MHTIRHAVFAIVISAGVGLLATASGLGRLQAQDLGWASVTIPANGVSLRVPLGLFAPVAAGDPTLGRVFAANGGEAQLLLGAFENDDGQTLAEHRQRVIETNYPGAAIDYAPLRRDWFVLSGTMGSRTFYQRVAFTCGGRLISSWAMLYPTSAKAYYNRLVERMHRSFVPGRGATGACGVPAGAN